MIEARVEIWDDEDAAADEFEGLWEADELDILLGVEAIWVMVLTSIKICENVELAAATELEEVQKDDGAAVAVFEGAWEVTAPDWRFEEGLEDCDIAAVGWSIKKLSDEWDKLGLAKANILLIINDWEAAAVDCETDDEIPKKEEADTAKYPMLGLVVDDFNVDDVSRLE